MRDIPVELRTYVNNYPIHVIEMRKFENTDVFRTDLKQIFDFIRFSEERDKLLALVQGDSTYQEMDEAANDMVAEYANAEGLIEMKKYHRKEGVSISAGGKITSLFGIDSSNINQFKRYGGPLWDVCLLSGMDLTEHTV